MDNIPENYRGCLESPEDSRDIILGVDVELVPDPNAPTWEQGFNNEARFGQLKSEHQGASLSCTGQGTSKYAEMVNLKETGEKTDLSAKFIYAQVALPGGGAYIRDAMLILVKFGVSEEATVPSYEDGKAPSESFMTNKSALTPAAFENAAKYRAKKLVFLPVSNPLTAQNWENLRQVIWQFGGVVSGWSSHCMVGFEYGLENGRKFIRFKNSYGEGSDQKYYGDQRLYDISALIDLPNPPDKIFMAKLYRDPSNYNEVYAVNNGKRSHITNKYSLTQGAAIGNFAWKEGDDIPVCPQPLWDSLEEIGETVFSPRD